MAMNLKDGFLADLERTENALSELELCMGIGRTDVEKTTQYLYRQYHRASLTGCPAEFAATRRSIDAALDRYGRWPDIWLLKANLEFKFHRLGAVEKMLAMLPGLAASPSGRVLQADLAFQLGNYDEARQGYERAIETDRTWDTLARLAYYQWKMGDEIGADHLYFEAEEELTAKEMRSFAWVELQRGVLDLQAGRYNDARQHYRRAETAYPGHWLTDEHIAELLGAEGHFSEAIALYKTIVQRVSKPELEQAIGELYLAMDRSEEAEIWFARALHAYLESTLRGEVQYYHHLVDFYSDVRKEGREAVKWARKDIALRNNYSTQAALAGAFYLDNRIAEAVTQIDLALSSSVKEARLFHLAAVIHLAAGHSDQGHSLLQLAVRINPHHENFHMHH
jgi:tetratricopeptide (TPR) repeat protein